MTTMRSNRLFCLSQGVPLSGPEADPVAQGGAGESGLAVPHDLVPGVRIVLSPGPVAAEMGDQVHRVSQPLTLIHI